MSPRKTYYVIYRKSPTQENPWNLSLIVITENPQAVGEFVSAAAQRQAMRVQDLEDQQPCISYRWYGETLLMKVKANPYLDHHAVYFAKTHHDDTLDVLFDDEEVQSWMLTEYDLAQDNHDFVMKNVIHGSYNDFTFASHTIYKVAFPTYTMT